MHKERGIAMVKPMVLQTLAGIKTETRRVVGDKQINRYGKVGDWLYVREKTEIDGLTSDIFNVKYMVMLRYLADRTLSDWVKYPERLALPEENKCIANGCYKEAARIWLENRKDPRIEPLRFMAHEDAINEGFEDLSSFFSYWDILNKKRGYGWNNNPDVWVIKYKILSTTGRPV